MVQEQRRAFATDTYDRVGAERLLGLLSSGTLLAQGPMGSMLMSEFCAQDIPAAYWNVAEPQEVTRIHRLYMDAGAQVAITNTFQASAPALERDGIESSVKLVCAEAVACAHAAGARNVIGSVGPCGVDWFKEDSAEYRRARSAYREQLHALYAAGCQACMFETFTSIRDLEPAMAAAADVADGMPVFVSFAVDDAGELLGDGLNIEAAVLWAEKHGADGVGVNCCSIDAATACVPRMAHAACGYVMARPHAGIPSAGEDGSVSWDEDPEAFARASVSWARDGARLVGACCGATPASTCAMADALDRSHELVEV